MNREGAVRTGCPACGDGWTGYDRARVPTRIPLSTIDTWIYPVPAETIYPIFDAHLDLALNGVDWNRDLTQSVDTLRARERELGMAGQPGRCGATVSLPELKRAGIRTCVATLLARWEPEINHPFGWSTPHACYAMAHAHLAYYRGLEYSGHATIIHTRQDLESHLQSTDQENGRLGMILTMEGADPLLEPETVEEFYHQGLRAIGLAHYGTNRYAGGTNSFSGLSVDAIPLLARIEELGMTLDVTHLSDRAFWQVLDRFSGRIHASHQNSRRLASWQRQFSDEQYRAVLARDGVIGIALDIIMLQEGYARRHSPQMATLQAVVENIDIVCQLAGDARHVGIGSDLDGGYGNDQTPRDLERISDLQRLPAMLSARGYSDEDIRRIMQDNWLHFFSQVLPAEKDKKNKDTKNERLREGLDSRT
ncbi:MAG: peptidase M19 [Planctomycetota bacterium]|nr:MAG: peptidase M19 [Planctomycetota bacterium]